MQKNRKSNTPIWDFVKQYKESDVSRFHMPGHKGIRRIGVEDYDITEIKGADSLYEADGIIAESERIASELFGSGATFYSTEGSSQCIRTMLYLAMMHAKKSDSNESSKKSRPFVVAARNVHKAFIYAAALLDFDVEWLWPEGKMHSLCSCPVTPKQVNNVLKRLKEEGRNPFAVYVTSPDYLGHTADIKELAQICHAYDTLFLVDNAHGAYLHFLEPSLHPLDLGADMCCDSAHKTLPVLTGGAYLHISKSMHMEQYMKVKQAMCLFGSTSPSYLTLSSLDLCNAQLAGTYRDRLKVFINLLDRIRKELAQAGWRVENSDPLRITIAVPDHLTGNELAHMLRTNGIECEYADKEYVVCMLTPENTQVELEALVAFLKEKALCMETFRYTKTAKLPIAKAKQVMSIRDAMFCDSETIMAEDAKGCICTTPTVGCPPAIPIAVPGELIEDNAIGLFLHYGIEKIEVVRRYT